MPSVKPKPKAKPNAGKTIASLGIALAAIALGYAPIPGLQQTITIVCGSELEEPLKQLEQQFEQQNPNIKIDLKIQGSQDMVNNFVDNKNDFQPTVLIPADKQFLTELKDRLQSQNIGEAFYEEPKPIAKTILVGISWPDRGKILFPNSQFQWPRLEQALQVKTWDKLGGNATWGSFDLLITDPTRSNSGQAALSLFAQAKAGSAPTATSLNSPTVQPLFGLLKQSVYQPSRSTDTLLREFIAKGPNEADVAIVYESIALARWQQLSGSGRKPYQIYYLNPTIESIASAGIMRRNVSGGQAQAARDFLRFLTSQEAQTVLVQNGFRPSQGIDFKAVPNSPWSQNIPGAQANPPTTVQSLPDRRTINEIVKLWQRAN